MSQMKPLAKIIPTAKIATTMRNASATNATAVTAENVRRLESRRLRLSSTTRTVVKCQSGDKFDAEKGLAMAVLKKLAGNDGSYNNFLNHWLKNAIVERV